MSGEGRERVPKRRDQQATAHGPWRCLPLGRTVSLIGGLAIAAAYFMFWFSISSGQGTAFFTGNLLNQILTGNPAALRQVGMSSDPDSVAALRTLVLLFPVSGVVAALLSLLGMLPRAPRAIMNGLLALAAVVPLVALAAGIQQLPAPAKVEFGLFLIGAGALGVLLGVALDLAAARGSRPGPE